MDANKDLDLANKLHKSTCLLTILKGAHRSYQKIVKRIMTELRLEKSWKDFKCHIIIQCLSIVLILVSFACALIAWEHDEKWTDELERISGIIFTNEKEVELLKREYPALLIFYMVGLLGALLTIIIHMALCIKFGKYHFTVGKMSRLITLIVGIGLLVIIFPAWYQAILYQSKYHELYDIDQRHYYYATVDANGTKVFEETHPFFYYCQWGNGRPVDWSKIRGIRLKKTGTAICQKIGTKIISFLLTLYVAIIYLSMNHKLTTPMREAEARNLVFLYELFGDYELAHDGAKGSNEEEAENFENFKQTLRNKTVDMPVPENLRAWLEGKKLKDSIKDDQPKYDVPDLKTYLKAQEKSDKMGAGMVSKQKLEKQKPTSLLKPPQ